jgi:hypothetical protein
MKTTRKNPQKKITHRNPRIRRVQKESPKKKGGGSCRSVSPSVQATCKLYSHLHEACMLTYTRHRESRRKEKKLKSQGNDLNNVNKEVNYNIIRKHRMIL